MKTALLAAALFTCSAGGPLPQSSSQSEAWARVAQGVAAYVNVRDEVLEQFGPIRAGSMAEVLAWIDARRRAVGAARPQAKAGDVIPPEAYEAVRAVLLTTLREHRIDVRRLLAERAADVPPGAPRAVINGRFPWQLGASTPPCVLEALPAMPSAIQYRFVGRDLYLVDIDIEMVVDIMPNALPSR